MDRGLMNVRVRIADGSRAAIVLLEVWSGRFGTLSVFSMHLEAHFVAVWRCSALVAGHSVGFGSFDLSARRRACEVNHCPRLHVHVTNLTSLHTSWLEKPNDTFSHLVSSHGVFSLRYS